MAGVKRVLAALGTAVVTLSLAAAPASAAGPTRVATLHGTRTWVTDAAGRVVILHGLNQVYKVPPYTPGRDGFGADDAAFLHRNGFDAVRVGVIWAAVEPRPGHYDNGYLRRIATTVRMLARHGIYSLLDFHQDLYNERFQGEGAPRWAVQDGGLPNPKLGFPGNYFANPAANHAWDQFWANAPAADGVGLQAHYARAWAHVAHWFRAGSHVLGYEIMNEPWPGTTWHPCLAPEAGCPVFDATLTAFYQRVVRRIRAVDHTHTIWFEPNVASASAATNHVGTVRGKRLGWAFHDYCPTISETSQNDGCPQTDDQTIAAMKQYGTTHHIPTLMTEFGATRNTANLHEMVALADKYRIGWTEWAYTGHDKTSTSPNGQALVLNPHKKPSGRNVVRTSLQALAEPYPMVVSGTPVRWKYASHVFRLVYRPARANRHGRFRAGSRTRVAVPRVQYPHGYVVRLSGARRVSARNAATLVLALRGGATRVTATVRARAR